MDRVAARAHNLGLPDRNAGIEAALEAWTDDTDADAPVSLKDILDEVRTLRAEVKALWGQGGQLGGQGGTTAGWNQFGPPATAAPDAPVATAAGVDRLKRAVAPSATLKFMSTDPDASPDVIPYPVPEPADRSAKRGRAVKCGHHVAAGTRCKICHRRRNDGRRRRRGERDRGAPPPHPRGDPGTARR